MRPCAVEAGSDTYQRCAIFDRCPIRIFHRSTLPVAGGRTGAAHRQFARRLIESKWADGSRSVWSQCCRVEWGGTTCRFIRWLPAFRAPNYRKPVVGDEAGGQDIQVSRLIQRLLLPLCIENLSFVSIKHKRHTQTMARGCKMAISAGARTADCCEQ